MKAQLGIVVLIVACVGLIVALVVVEKQTDTRQKKDADTILDFSNQLTTASASLDELRQVNLMLTNDLETGRQGVVTFSNRYVTVANSLSNTKAALKSAQDQIADLEAQNEALDQRAIEMTNTISNLSAQITETQMKLVASETNNVFLENELKRQVAERAELEHKFNNLSQVRKQVRKLRDDLLVARRLEWKREGISPSRPRKGAQLLMEHARATGETIRPPGYNLNVEVTSEGSVKVIPTPTTNAPTATNSLRQ